MGSGNTRRASWEINSLSKVLVFLHNGQHGRATHITCTCSRQQSLQFTRGTCCSRQPLPKITARDDDGRWLTSAEKVDLCAAIRGYLHVFCDAARRERCRLAVCSAGCNVANGVRFNGEKANGPCVIYEGERFLFLGCCYF